MEDLSIFNGQFFDILFVCHSLEHCETPINAIKEFKRVLKSKGWLFIATPSPCVKQITYGDADHIFVLNAMQWQKILNYVGGWSEVGCYLQTDNISLLQDFNVISIGRKA